MTLRRHISTISGKIISLAFIIIIIVIVINIFCVINIVVITCNLAIHFFSSTAIEETIEDFSPCFTESGHAANVEKTKYILKSREEERRQNRNVRVANIFLKMWQFSNTFEQQ